MFGLKQAHHAAITRAPLVVVQSRSDAASLSPVAKSR